MQTRSHFLQNQEHTVFFVYTPKHCSWLNQIEIWFSILSRKLLKRANFSSIEELKTTLLEFIAYFNIVLAKPFKWNYNGKPCKAWLIYYLENVALVVFAPLDLVAITEEIYVPLLSVIPTPPQSVVVGGRHLHSHHPEPASAPQHQNHPDLYPCGPACPASPLDSLHA